MGAEGGRYHGFTVNVVSHRQVLHQVGTHGEPFWFTYGKTRITTLCGRTFFSKNKRVRQANTYTVDCPECCRRRAR